MLGSLKMVRRSLIHVVSYTRILHSVHNYGIAYMYSYKTCILSDCPVKGQVFNECGSACPPNCTTPNPICTRQCVPRCECPRGTVINELTNKCVPVKNCPKGKDVKIHII